MTPTQPDVLVDRDRGDGTAVLLCFRCGQEYAGPPERECPRCQAREIVADERREPKGAA